MTLDAAITSTFNTNTIYCPPPPPCFFKRVRIHWKNILRFFSLHYVMTLWRVWLSLMEWPDEKDFIIILSRNQHGYSWPSLTTAPYRSSLPVGPEATSRILRELLNVSSKWLPCFYMAIWRVPLENIIYEHVPTSPAFSCMSGSSNLDSFRDGW